MMQLKKLGAFGAEVDGVDLAGNFDFRDVEKAFFDHQLLVFRRQKLDAGQFLATALRAAIQAREPRNPSSNAGT